MRYLRLNEKAVLVKTGLTCLVMSASSFPLNAQGKPLAPIPITAACTRLRESPTVDRYVTMLDSLTKLGFDSMPTFDTKDSLVTKWAIGRFGHGVGVLGRSIAVLGKSKAEQVDEFIKQCAYALRQDRALAFILPNSTERAAYRVVVNRLAAPQAEQQRVVNADGTVGTVAVATAPIDLSDRRVRYFYIGRFDDCAAPNGLERGSPCFELFRTNAGAVSAFFEPNNTKILESVSDEVFSILPKATAYVLAAIQKSAEATAAAQADRQRVEAERQQRATDAQQSERQKKERLAAIRAGDWSTVKSCVEVAYAFADANQLDDGLAAALKPHGGVKAFVAKLVSFDESTLLGTGTMVANSQNVYVEATTTKATKWFDKSSIRIGGTVSVVGVYEANDVLTLTNGAHPQVAAIRATCVSAN